MALDPADVAKFGSAQQRVECRFVTFAASTTLNKGDFTDGAYSFLDMVNCHPRHSWVANSGTITLDGNDSIQRGGAASTGHSWTLDSGGGSLVDNLDGTADYTAPAAGTGTALIYLETAGNAIDNEIRVAYGDDSVEVGKITGFHADIGTGGWELTLQAFGDCTGLERQKGILVVVDDYYNGSEDTFGGYKWANGVFYGYVDRIRSVNQDFQQAYLEVRVTSPSILWNHGQGPDLLFVKTDTADDNVVIADFEVMDAVWWLITESTYNIRHNCYISDDDNSVANLKLGRGPYFDVIRDVAARSFYIVYDSKLGDTYVVGDPDVRYSNYFTDFDAVFDVDNDIIERFRLEWEDICDPEGDPPDPPDPTYSSVAMTAIQSDLTELTAEYPSSIVTDGGRLAEVGGLICETQADLDLWAKYYWYKLQPSAKGSIDMFLMHHLDLYDALTWSTTIRELSNTGVGSIDGQLYVTGIDYDVDPGMGTWRGQVQFVSRAPQS